MIKLSNRLQAVADYVTPGSRLADIGSDHALLPASLLLGGRCPRAIAGELNLGPMQAAQRQAAAAGLTDRLDVRQGDGLEVLEPGEADTVTISGMGGALIRSILEKGKADGKLDSVRELVLQPNIGEDAVRSWLLEEQWYLDGETILEEDGKTYEILHAVRTDDADRLNGELYDAAILPDGMDGPVAQAILLRMGPHLLRQADDALIRKWRGELAKQRRIADQMGDSELPQAAAKRLQLLKEISMIEEVLNCLPTVKRSFN